MDDVALRNRQEEELKARYRVVTAQGVSGTAVPMEFPSSKPTAVHGLQLGGKREVRCIARRDHLVYAGVWGGGLAVVDLRDVMRPQLVGKIEGPAELSSLLLVGNTLYASDWSAGLRVLDVSNPAQPTVLATHPALAYAQNRRVLVHDSMLALVNEHAISVFDVSTPARPRPLAVQHRMRTGVGWFRGASLTGTTLLVTQGSMGFWAFDLSDPAQPRVLGGLGVRLESRPNDRVVIEAVTMFEGRAFAGTSSGVWAVRFAPTGPESEMFFTGPGCIHETAKADVRDGRLYFCAFEPHDDVHHVFDVANGARYLGRQRLNRAQARIWDYAFGPNDTVAAAGNDGILITAP